MGMLGRFTNSVSVALAAKRVPNKQMAHKAILVITVKTGWHKAFFLEFVFIILLLFQV